MTTITVTMAATNRRANITPTATPIKIIGGKIRNLEAQRSIYILVPLCYAMHADTMHV